jgi:hypothetical protein
VRVLRLEHVEAQFALLVHVALGSHRLEASVWIDESFDQPGARDPVHENKCIIDTYGRKGRGATHSASDREESMNRGIWPLALAGVTLVAFDCSGREEREEKPAEHARTASAPAMQVNWTAVEQALGRSGAPQPGDVYKFGLPRSDLTVTVDRIQLKPALALGSWVAFKATSSGATAMGDLVLRDDEIEPVMAKLVEGGLEVTAFHHHVLHEIPRVYYMHIHGAGEAVKLARAVRAAVDVSHTPPPATGPAASAAGPLGIDTARIAQVLGHSGKVNGGVYQVSVARPDTTWQETSVIPPAMGIATALNFQSTGAGNAAITGDFVLRAAEVNPVLRVLRERGIEVTAVHNHMLDEQPRLFFMHFWAVGDAVKLAEGLRAALDKVNVRRPS